MNALGHRGFTLVELMVTLTILAILVTLGAPSYEQWIRNTRIRNASESIQNGLRSARNEAAQRNTNVRFELTTAAVADWAVCVLPAAATASTPCGGAVPIEQFSSKGGAGSVQIYGSKNVADLGTLKTAPLTAAVAAASGVTFNALGRPLGYGATSLLRIDATAAATGSRRYVTTVTAGGTVRMCDADPNLAFSATSPQGCQ
jgi:type IV fimbrial biogenesis protein FimT